MSEREVKFRVWDKVLSEMVYPEWEEDYVGCGNRKIGLYIFRSTSDSRAHSSLSWALRHPEHFILEQFTGRNDSTKTKESPDGKPIYQGDVLRSYHFLNHKKQKRYLHHIVEWSERHLGWAVCDVGEQGKKEMVRQGSPPLWVYLQSSDEVEIVGNIYQHPELLK